MALKHSQVKKNIINQKNNIIRAFWWDGKKGHKNNFYNIVQKKMDNSEENQLKITYKYL